MVHIHGGGWVIMSEKSSDPLLQFYADKTECTVISVGYRLAPEHPYPAGVNDCFDASNYIMMDCELKYGGPLKFMGGEVCVISLPCTSSRALSFHTLRK